MSQRTKAGIHQLRRKLGLIKELHIIRSASIRLTPQRKHKYTHHHPYLQIPKYISPTSHVQVLYKKIIYIR